jgi:hypothetical protein
MLIDTIKQIYNTLRRFLYYLDGYLCSVNQKK